MVTPFPQRQAVSEELGICFSSKRLEVPLVREGGESPGVHVSLIMPSLIMLCFQEVGLNTDLLHGSSSSQGR